ncbi:MAG TPA: hypothetical protein VGP63_28850 [Planctomycetaceae bacterium]|nr:hypothetical protein [Planctomycetaceae bacterium]
MTQRGGSLSYVTFGAGFSLLVYALFYVLADISAYASESFGRLGPTRWPPTCCMESSGGGGEESYSPRCPAWYVITGLCFDFFLIWPFVRTLEKNKIFLRV